jgi:hypothetical protein
MQTQNKSMIKSWSHFFMVMITLFFAQTTTGQITVYQHRYVAPDKVDEFVKRETTYWSEVAKKGIEKKKMTFWALLEKVGGTNMQHSANYLFVNTFPNIDSAFAGDFWDPTKLFPNVSIDKIETGSISTTTATYFLHEENWVQRAKADPEKEFKYVMMVQHKTNNPDSLIGLEKKHWMPFIQKAMDNKQVPLVGWGNAILLSPRGGGVDFNTVSYDLFSTLQDALMPRWDPKVVIPDGLNLIDKLENGPRNISIYRIVKVVN